MSGVTSYLLMHEIHYAQASFRGIPLVRFRAGVDGRAEYHRVRRQMVIAVVVQVEHGAEDPLRGRPSVCAGALGEGVNDAGVVDRAWRRGPVPGPVLGLHLLQGPGGLIRPAVFGVQVDELGVRPRRGLHRRVPGRVLALEGVQQTLRGPDAVAAQRPPEGVLRLRPHCRVDQEPVRFEVGASFRHSFLHVIKDVVGANRGPTGSDAAIRVE